MKKFFFILLATLPFWLTTCTDKEPQYLGEYKLGPGGEAYIKFEPGSYWVYENDKTGERDSITMEWYSSEMIHFEGLRREYYREHIQFRWLGNSGEYTFTSLHGFPDLTPQDAFERGLKHWSIPASKTAIGESAIMHMPPTYNSGGGVIGQTSLVTQTYDSLQVSGEWFYEVAEFEVDNDWLWNTFDTNHTKYYWAKNIGLIRRVLLEEHSQLEVESFNLIKYEVIR